MVKVFQRINSVQVHGQQTVYFRDFVYSYVKAQFDFVHGQTTAQTKTRVRVGNYRLVNGELSYSALEPVSTRELLLLAHYTNRREETNKYNKHTYTVVETLTIYADENGHFLVSNVYTYRDKYQCTTTVTFYDLRDLLTEGHVYDKRLVDFMTYLLLNNMVQLVR